VQAGISHMFLNIWSVLEKRGLPPDVWQRDPLTFWRERLLFVICFVAAVFGPIALVPSVLLAYAEGLWGVIFLDFAAYFTAVGILLGRGLPLKFRASAACFFLYFLGTGLLFFLGPIGAGYIWLFGASVLMSAIVGLRAALLTLGFNVLTLLAVGLWITWAVPDWSLVLENPLEKWAVISSNFLILNALVTITTAIKLNALKKALYKEQQNSASLRKSEDRFRSLFEGISGIAVQGCDAERRVVYWNQASTWLYGYCRDEAMGRRLEGLIVPDSMQRQMIERFRSWIEQGRVVSQEEMHLENKAGEPVPVYTSRVMHTDAQGEQVIFRIDVPLAPLHRAEAERDRLQLAIEQSDDMIVVTDAQGRFQYVNPAFANVTGYAQQEVIDCSMDLLRGDDAPDAQIYEQMWQTVVRGRAWRGTLKNQKKDGTRYVQESSITPIVDTRGRITDFISVSRDITEQVRMQAEKAALEEQHRQSRKVEAVGRLAGGVAHDLNNMLSPILGYGEMLQLELREKDVRREYVDEVLKAGVRARDLVRQLLAFSRKQALEYKVIDLNEVLSGIEKLLCRTIRENIAIDIVPACRLPAVRADTGQVEQVILNLAVNAQDAMPEGGTIMIETGRSDLDEAYAAAHAGVEPGVFARLAVTDTGCGMAPDTVEMVFEPFFSTKGEDGTGLGLATVYGIVKQHGGHIWVYSEPGKGSTFKVYLPATDALPAEHRESRQSQASLRGSETIVIAEDHQQVRDLAAMVLKQQGYTVLTAQNGSCALDVLQQHTGPVDLLVTDVVMPETNGRELFERACRIHPGIKVLYMSGYTDDVIVHQGVLEEGIAFLQKPFNVRALAGKVREVLDQAAKAPAVPDGKGRVGSNLV